MSDLILQEKEVQQPELKPEFLGPGISLCIPTYKEQDYIVDTLNHLADQTLWPLCEVIIADYDPDNTKSTEKAFDYAGMKNDGLFSNVKFVYVDKKGIGYARGFAVSKSTKPYIMSFDADCRFSSPYAMERLMTPIISGRAQVTHCPNVLDTEETANTFDHGLYLLRNDLLKFLPIAYEPGLTMTREAYEKIGGWPEVTAGEAPLLAMAALMTLGSHAIKYVEEIYVLCSARRLASKDFNYEVAYRKGQKMRIQ